MSIERSISAENQPYLSRSDAVVSYFEHYRAEQNIFFPYYSNEKKKNNTKGYCEL